MADVPSRMDQMRMDLSTEAATRRLLGGKSTDEMELIWFVNITLAIQKNYIESSLSVP
jgi:phosphate-selective porin